MDPYIGEIRIFAGSFAPLGWLFCDGQTLPQAQYQPLYAILGTTYGSAGANTFTLPDLRDKVPMHQGQGTGLTNKPLGGAGGVAAVTLTAAQMPNHTHNVMCKNAPSGTDMKADPANNVWGAGQTAVYGPDSSNIVPMDSRAVGMAGTANPAAHNNLQPYLGVHYIIAYEGIWPERP